MSAARFVQTAVDLSVFLFGRCLPRGEAAGAGDHKDQARLALCRQRWRRNLRQGFRALREQHWFSWKLEPKRAWYRNALLLETVASWNVTAPRAIKDRPRKILLIRLGHLGDILQTVPLAREWKRQDQDIEIHLLCGPWAMALAERFPYFDRRIRYAPQMVQYHRGNAKQALSWREELKFLRELRAQQYDAVVSTTPLGVAERIIQQAVDAPMWIGVPLAMDGYPLPARRLERAFESKTPEAEWGNSFLPLLGLESGRTDLEFPISEGDRHEVDALLAESKTPLKPRVLAMAPGAGWPGKCWQPEKFAAVADRAVEQANASVVLVGSRNEVELCHRVSRAMRGPSENFAGRTSLGGLAELLRRCHVLLCNDSAALHFAAAVGTPTISIFGPTSPEKWAPEGEKHRVFKTEIECDGCVYWHCRAACAHDLRCMNSISARAVGDAVLEVLSRS